MNNRTNGSEDRLRPDTARINDVPMDVPNSKMTCGSKKLTDRPNTKANNGRDESTEKFTNIYKETTEASR